MSFITCFVFSITPFFFFDTETTTVPFKIVSIFKTVSDLFATADFRPLLDGEYERQPLLKKA